MPLPDPAMVLLTEFLKPLSFRECSRRVLREALVDVPDDLAGVRDYAESLTFMLDVAPGSYTGYYLGAPIDEFLDDRPQLIYCLRSNATKLWLLHNRDMRLELLQNPALTDDYVEYYRTYWACDLVELLTLFYKRRDLLC